MIVLRSEREIGRMRLAGLLVWEAHRRVAELVRVGATTGELDQVVDELFAEQGATPLFKGVPGKVPFPAATCVSVNEEIVHGIPSDRRLAEADIVSVDTGCRLNGWCGDAAVTHPVGTISSEVRGLLDTTNQALHLAVELLGKKSRWSEVAAEMQRLVNDAGMTVIEEFVGHGIGRDMHEAPQVPNFDHPKLWKTGDFELRPGLVLAIEPMVSLGKKDVVYHDDHWTAATRDGSWSAHFEHTVALTGSGPRLLTGPPDSDECDAMAAIGCPLGN